MSSTGTVSLSAIIALIFTFWTGTFFVIINLAYTRYEAAIFVAGVFGLVAVAAYNWATTGRWVR